MPDYFEKSNVYIGTNPGAKTMDSKFCPVLLGFCNAGNPKFFFIAGMKDSVDFKTLENKIATAKSNSKPFKELLKKDFKYFKGYLKATEGKGKLNIISFDGTNVVEAGKVENSMKLKKTEFKSAGIDFASGQVEINIVLPAEAERQIQTDKELAGLTGKVSSADTSNLESMLRGRKTEDTSSDQSQLISEVKEIWDEAKSKAKVLIVDIEKEILTYGIEYPEDKEDIGHDAALAELRAIRARIDTEVNTYAKAMALDSELKKEYEPVIDDLASYAEEYKFKGNFKTILINAAEEILGKLAPQ